MEFLAPAWHWMFFALAALPIVIYLIFRRKRRDVGWGAMYILRRLLEQRTHTKVWKQYALLALRTLALLLLAFAFLWPALPWSPPEGDAFPAPPPSTHRILLLDTSGSMRAKHQGTTRLDAAIGLTRRIVRSGRSPGRVDVLPLDGRAEPMRFDDLPPSRTEVDKLVARLERGEGSADFRTGLQRALELARASRFEHKEVLILSDFSRRDLGDPDELRGLFGALHDTGAEVFCRSYAAANTHNSAVLDATAHRDVLPAGRPALFELTLGYFGTAEKTKTRLTIRDQDGTVLHRKQLELAQGRTRLRIPLTLEAGSRVLTFGLREDDYAPDNALQRSYRAEKTFKLLAVQEVNPGGGFENPRRWLRLAMGPKKRRKEPDTSHRSKGDGNKDKKKKAGKPAAYRLEFLSPSQVKRDVLADRDAVILLDLDKLSERARGVLRRYTLRGGLVLLAPGPTAKPDTFNKRVAPLGPARLGKPLHKEIDPKRYVHPVPASGAPPLVRQLDRPCCGQISNARIYNHYQVPRPDGIADAARVMLALSDGAPLLIGERRGRGRSWLWTAGLGMQWQSAVVHPVQPVLLQRLAEIGAESRRFDRNLEPGEPILAAVGTDRSLIQTPKGGEVTVEPASVGDRKIVRYEKTKEPGRYTLYPDADARRNEIVYTVRGKRRESDYRPLTPPNREAFEAAAGTTLHREPGAFVAAVGGRYTGLELATLIAAGILLVVLVEAGLARRWFA